MCVINAQLFIIATEAQSMVVRRSVDNNMRERAWKSECVFNGLMTPNALTGHNCRLFSLKSIEMISFLDGDNRSYQEQLHSADFGPILYMVVQANSRVELSHADRTKMSL